MILPDINLLVFAYNRHAPHHAEAKAWWEGLLNGSEPVGIPWAVVCGFVRLMTHPAVLVDPLDPGRTLLYVRSWFERPLVEVLEPGPRHLEILERLLKSLGVAANLTTDAHLAAIAIEHQCELHSNDADFSRFAGLRWRNPL
ncbi:MAG: type II toxin-antitoxin system VapC family toxin [Thermoanaerobaculia bacterium]|nr:type II toxin-antitoxin system VapC family toxin [Thermoanaerobaculia bacterium]